MEVDLIDYKEMDQSCLLQRASIWLIIFNPIFFLKISKQDYEAQQRLGLNIPSKSKTTRMEMEYMGVELYPISPTQTKMKMVLKFDPKIKYLPLSFINWHVRKVCFLKEFYVIYCAFQLGHIFVDRIVNRASNFKVKESSLRKIWLIKFLQGSLWERKIQENRDLYGFMEERFNEYLQSKNF